MKDNIEIIGKKVGMTQVYNDKGQLIPVTVIEAGPCPVTQIKTTETDGYNAVQIGYKAQKEQRLSQAQKGHLKKSGCEPVAHVKEFRTENTSDFNLGDILTVERFQEGENVDVVGTTIGRGFQGVVKRYNFGGGPRSHGSMMHRRGGSYGHCQWPGEVQKGKKMPGHMGNVQRTTQNLEVVKVLADKNILLIKGSFAGSKGSTVVIRKAKKAKSAA